MRQSKSFFDIVKNNPNYSRDRSWQWFTRNARQLASGMSTQQHLGDNLVLQAKSFLPGQMIQFFYSAKYQDKLPYWDTFPCCLPFSMTATHFTGLNLHYIRPQLRFALLDKLSGFMTDDRMTPRARMTLSWKLLKQASKFPEVGPCVKQYILGRVKSNFLIIPPEDWPIAISLPTESFRGAKATTVFGESTKQMNGYNNGK